MKLRSLIVVLVLLATATQVHAINCRGTVTHTWVTHNGALHVHATYRGDHTMICNTVVEWHGIAPETCRVWATYASIAHQTGSEVIVQYNLSHCSLIGTYSNAQRPNYFMLY